MKTAIFIGRRLSLKTESGHNTSPGVVTGVIGIALALIIMLLSLAVVQGFKREIINKLVGFNSQITIYAPQSSDSPNITSGVRLTDSLRQIINNAVQNGCISLTLRQPAIFKTDTDFQGIILKGLSAGNSWNFIKENLSSGFVPDSTDSDPNNIVISSSIATKLNVNIGQKLATHFFDGNTIRTRNLYISGIYDTHFHDYDNAFAFTPANMLQHFNKIDSITGTAVEISGIKTDMIQPLTDNLYNDLVMVNIENPANPMPYSIENITNTCVIYFSWLDLLDTNVLVIIILMSCVSAFTLVSSLFIIILERVNTIGLLKAIGATNSQVRRIFIYMAERLVIKGLIIGNVIALLIIYMQSVFHILPLDPEAYYLNYVPMYLDWSVITLVNIAVIAISVIILIFPSHIIAHLSPSKTLRFE